MNEKLLTYFSFVLILISGCSPKIPPQAEDKTFFDNQILSLILICGEISDYHEKKGCWPDSIERLKDYSPEPNEQYPKIDWDRYKLQAVPDGNDGKVRIEYYTPQISFSIVLTISSEKCSGSSETLLQEQLNKKLFKKKNN